jgi:mannose-6-phosphate isomerase
MFVLTNAIREYAWGSTTQMARFLDEEPTKRPQAELWMGAHDGDPSTLPDDRRLNDAIRADPAAMLGEHVRELFGDRLPYLMKVLAVAEPLSLQVHPSSERARIGFAHESALGIAVDAPERNYRDHWHKPELVYALTRFEGMAGFRDVERSADVLRLLNLPWADDIAVRLESGPPFQTLRSVVTDLLALQGKPLKRLLHEVGIAAVHAEARAHREELKHRASRTDRSRLNREAIRVFAQTGKLVQQYPLDPGVLVTLLLNHVVLAPGEAMFINAGVLHAYASGFGLEIMASSDNVLRAGLTPKHMDVEELLHVTDFTPIPPPRWDPAERRADFCYLEPPVTEFSLTVGSPPLPRLPAAGPRVLLVLEGTAEVSAGAQRVTIGRGESVFIEHADGAFTVEGQGRVAVGAVPVS